MTPTAGTDTLPPPADRLTPTPLPRSLWERLAAGKPFPWDQPALYVALAILALGLFGALFRLALARSRSE